MTDFFLRSVLWIISLWFGLVAKAEVLAEAEGLIERY